MTKFNFTDEEFRNVRRFLQGLPSSTKEASKFLDSLPEETKLLIERIKIKGASLSIGEDLALKDEVAESLGKWKKRNDPNFYSISD